MPPHPKRDRCVILYDLNCENQRLLRQALLKIYSYYYFRSSKDLVNLVLVNSETTRNRMNQRKGAGFQNITEVNQQESLSFNPTYAHSNIEVNNSDGCNWKEALRVALQIIQDDKTPRVITYKILFLTDLSTVTESKENIDNIIEGLNRHGIFLYIVGPNITYSQVITKFEDLKSLLRDVSVENPNLIEAKQAVLKCENAILSNVIVGLHLFFTYKNPIGKQSWNVPLSIGSKIQYKVGTLKLMEKTKGFQLKRKDQIPRSYIYVSVEDGTKVYEEKDVRRGILKHGKFIPLQSNELFKEKLDRMFSVVFATKTKNVPEYMMKGPGCYSVIAANKSAEAAFFSLLFRLNELESCLIAKRVYNKGNTPIYLALIPLCSKKCFRAVQLPYGSQVPFEWPEQEARKNVVDISESVQEFLEKVTVGSNRFSLNCPMTPNVMISSRGGSLLNSATVKILGETNLRLQNVDLDPFSTGINSEIGDKLRNLWPSRGPVAVRKEHIDESDDDDADYF